MQLSPCPGCARHVRSTDTLCPFCGGEVAHRPPVKRSGVAPQARKSKRVAPLSRVALFYFGTMAASCGTETTPGPETEQETDNETIMQPYGAPPEPPPPEPPPPPPEVVEPPVEDPMPGLGPVEAPPEPTEAENDPPRQRVRPEPPVERPEAPSIAAYGTPSDPEF